MTGSAISFLRATESSPRKRGSCGAGPGHRALGFTLLEVMIALLIIVIGTAAVINTSTESTWKSAQLWERTVAGWVAQNQIAEYRARRSWGNDRRLTGKTEMANAEWEWEMQVSDTDDPSLRRLDIEVFLEDQEGAKARLTAFIARL
jgi:general secretion pathway protein I